MASKRKHVNILGSIRVNTDLIEDSVIIKKEMVKYFRKLFSIRKIMRLADLQCGIRRLKKQSMMGLEASFLESES